MENTQDQLDNEAFLEALKKWSDAVGVEFKARATITDADEAHARAVIAACAARHEFDVVSAKILKRHK